MVSKQAGRLAGVFGLVVLLSAIFNWIFVTGVITSPGVIVRFVLAIAGIALWIVATRDEQRLNRGAFYGTVSFASTVVVLAALAAVNYIAVKKPKTWDLTKDKIFTLSDSTVSAVKGLSQPVTVQAFFGTSDPEYGELSQRLDQYKSNSDKLTVEFIDPVKHPAEVAENKITQTGPRIIVKSGAKESRAKDATEESLTNAILDVTHGSTKKIYFVKGHGEHPVEDTTERGFKNLDESLNGEGYKTDTILLAATKKLPDDVQALIIGGPVAAFQESEVKLLKEYVEGGGKLVVMIDPGVESGLETMLGGFDLKLDNDIVIDPESQEPEVALAQTYADHPITKARSTPFQQMTIFPLSRTVGRVQSPPPQWSEVDLAMTGKNAWGETDMASIKAGRVQYNEGKDVKGPVTVAAAANRGVGESESRIVLFGNSLFAANGYLRLGGNRDFALNAVSWAAKDESRISIRPKLRQANRLFLSAEQKHTMTLFAFDLLPFGLLFAGLSVWQTRKSR